MSSIKEQDFTFENSIIILSCFYEIVKCDRMLSKYNKPIQLLHHATAAACVIIVNQFNKSLIVTVPSFYLRIQ